MADSSLNQRTSLTLSPGNEVVMLQGIETESPSKTLSLIEGSGTKRERRGDQKRWKDVKLNFLPRGLFAQLIKPREIFLMSSRRGNRAGKSEERLFSSQCMKFGTLLSLNSGATLSESI